MKGSDSVDMPHLGVARAAGSITWGAPKMSAHDECDGVGKKNVAVGFRLCREASLGNFGVRSGAKPTSVVAFEHWHDAARSSSRSSSTAPTPTPTPRGVLCTRHAKARGGGGYGSESASG